jgi:hypothetical protein
MAVTIADLEYGKRDPQEFIQDMITSSGIHANYSIFDGVKDKQQLPIFKGTLVFGNNICEFDPQSTADITEKEFTVNNYKWAFKNCKTALQRSYRSLMLKKGANNDETMDSQFKDWIYDHFSFLAGKHVGQVATTEIQDEIDNDGAVNKETGAAGSLPDSQDPTAIEALMDDIYQKIPENMFIGQFNPDGTVNNVSGEGLTFLLPVGMYRALHIALNKKYTTSEKEQIEKGTLVPSYMGIPIMVNPDADDSDVIVSRLDNFVTVVDELGDVEAIQSKYYEELSSDYLWGQFSIGFSYKVSEEIYHYELVA